MKLHVALNGTAVNPYIRLGFTQNPIPQLVVAEYADRCLRLQQLGGPPIPPDRAGAYIRETLTGFSEEFIDLCVRMYRPGQYIEFSAEFHPESERRAMSWAK